MKPKMGQNFLTDHSAAEEIVSELGAGKEDIVIEIGAGHGILSELAENRCAHLILIEKDRDLANELSLRFRLRHNVSIVCEDASHVDYSLLIPEKHKSRKILVLGNLPYDAGIRIYFNLLSQISLFSRMILMFQKEVAERIAANEGSRKYGVPSIMTAVFAEAEIIRTYAPDAFRPRPKVRSSLVMIIPRKFPLISLKDSEQFHMFLEKIFRYRRKTIKNAIAFSMPSQPDINDEIFSRLAITGKERPEKLDVQKLYRLFLLCRD
jgi:16S rRNA (adenine1518-N6/adenine1519-N6)-dimethyltransferase